MSLLEKRRGARILNDSAPITCSIISAQNVDGHTVSAREGINLTRVQSHGLMHSIIGVLSYRRIIVYYTCNVQEYSLECRRQYGFLSESTKLWTVSKRFSDFVLLDSSLGQAGSQLQLNLPKKKMMGNMGNTNIQIHDIIF